MEEGRMTVQLYERDSLTDSSVLALEQKLVLAAVISHGDKRVQVSMDEERGRWEIEVLGESTVYHP